MTTPAYDDIDDIELIPGKPITSSLLTRLRDNLLSVIGAGSGAPLIERLAINAAGTGADGAWINGTTISGLGYFEPSSIVFSSGRSLPGISVIRCSDDVTISAAVTLDTVTAAQALGALFHLRATMGSVGGNESVAAHSGGGGANVGNGGSGSDGAGGTPGLSNGGAGYAVSGLYHDFLSLNPRLGGYGGQGGNGAAGGNSGGTLILIVEGDLDMSGGTLTVDGGAGSNGAGPTDGGGGGGAGGTIIIIVTGTITGGTYQARGGAGGARTGGGGGGGGGSGGRIVLVASAFSGSRTKTVTGGAAGGTPGFGTVGASGQADEITLTAAQIRGLLFRSY